jgi:hypothetical protein
MEDAMLLYVFWASLCLGLMKLSADAGLQERNRNAPQAIAQRRKARHN